MRLLVLLFCVLAYVIAITNVPQPPKAFSADVLLRSGFVEHITVNAALGTLLLTTNDSRAKGATEYIDCSQNCAGVYWRGACAILPMRKPDKLTCLMFWQALTEASLNGSCGTVGTQWIYKSDKVEIDYCFRGNVPLEINGLTYSNFTEFPPTHKTVPSNGCVCP